LAVVALPGLEGERADRVATVEQQQPAAVAHGGHLGAGQPPAQPDDGAAEIDHAAAGDGVAGERNPGRA
jgi:hypothetical protein